MTGIKDRIEKILDDLVAASMAYSDQAASLRSTYRRILRKGLAEILTDYERTPGCVREQCSDRDSCQCD